MVQVGNETTGGFIGETNVRNMCVLFSAGAAGVKTYNPDVKVVIHVESPHKRTMEHGQKICRTTMLIMIFLPPVIIHTGMEH
jgi:arabinogalactan endo-1,4-beta-galactosidase